MLLTGGTIILETEAAARTVVSWSKVSAFSSIRTRNLTQRRLSISKEVFAPGCRFCKVNGTARAPTSWTGPRTPFARSAPPPPATARPVCCRHHRSPSRAASGVLQVCRPPPTGRHRARQDSSVLTILPSLIRARAARVASRRDRCGLRHRTSMSNTSASPTASRRIRGAGGARGRRGSFAPQGAQAIRWQRRSLYAAFEQMERRWWGVRQIDHLFWRCPTCRLRQERPLLMRGGAVIGATLYFDDY